jgi:hypothetical protein
VQWPKGGVDKKVFLDPLICAKSLIRFEVRNTFRDGLIVLAVGKAVATGIKRGKIFSDVHTCDRDDGRNDVRCMAPKR